jgi:hypothetical protein
MLQEANTRFAKNVQKLASGYYTIASTALT